MTEILLTRRGTSLVARDEYSESVVMALDGARPVFCDVRQARNPKQHQLLFVLLKKISENDPKGRSVEALLRELKIAARMFTPIVGVRGEAYYVLDSISFASMPQQEFRRVFDRFVDILITDIVPGIGSADLLAEVLEAVG